MTDHRQIAGSVPPLDDAAIERLVREVAAGWQMPPLRLDAPSWRERVRSPRARRADAARGWLARAGRAGSAAVALTIVAALAAVLITRPPSDAGKSPAPSREATPGPTGGFTPLPKLLLDGDQPQPATVLLRGEGDFALADLTTGKLGASFVEADFESAMVRSIDGSLVCLCITTTNRVNGQPTRASVALKRFDASGAERSSVVVVTIAGEPDPRDGAIEERPAHLAVETSFSDDGRFGFVGWSFRAHPVWKSGVTVVDTTDGHEAARLGLPDTTSGEGDTRRVQAAPRVLGSGGHGRLVLAREWYSWSPPESASRNYRQETDVFAADFGVDGREVQLASPTAIDLASCGPRVIRAGAVGGTWWIACVRGSSNQLVVRRFDAAGGRLGESTAPGAAGVDGDMTTVTPDGAALYAWSPTAALLTRIDLVTGEATEGRAGSAGAPGPLAGLGEWLAPTAAAKSFLLGSVAVSPDGRRVYAIGVDPGAVASDVSGSSGIFVFDAATLESLGRWEPTADFVSIAVSADGRYVYAAGLPGVDANGAPRSRQPASITVFDAADGSVRLIAGQLGGGLWTFPTRVVP